MSQQSHAEQEDGPSLDVELLETTFALLAPSAEELATRFYDALFRRHPGLRPLFADADMREQKRKLFATLAFVVTSLRKPTELEAAVASLGRKHQGYGAMPQHYAAVTETMLSVMEEFAGTAWTPEVATAWKNALQRIANKMLSGYAERDVAAHEKAKESPKGRK